jgi:hypothetical protein
MSVDSLPIPPAPYGGNQRCHDQSLVLVELADVVHIHHPAQVVRRDTATWSKIANSDRFELLRKRIESRIGDEFFNERTGSSITRVHASSANLPAPRSIALFGTPTSQMSAHGIEHGAATNDPTRLGMHLCTPKGSNLHLRRLLRSRIYNAIVRQSADTARSDRKAMPTMQLVGCTVSELRAHLERQFRPGMRWDNLGAWHIDHIKPCAAFDLRDPEQQRACFHFTNLQPLWARENLSKSDRIAA